MSPHVALIKSQLHSSGGAEKYTLRLAAAFRKKGCKVTLLTSGPFQTHIHDPDLTVVSFPKLPSLSFRRVLSFDRFCTQTLQTLNPNLILGMDRTRKQTHLRASNGVHAAFLRKRRQTDPFWKQLSHKINPLHHTLLNIEKASFEDPELQKLFTNSYMVRDEILEFYSTDQKKIQVVHNGVEWEELGAPFNAWQTEKSTILKETCLDPSVFQFLFIGHNYQRKGLAPLLQGLALLKEKNFHLSVIGKEKNMNFFKQLVEELGLKKQVTFFGSRTDIPRFYQLADALIIPSFYDPFANVTVEALAMGVYVVSSLNNGGHEILTSQNGAVISDLSDPENIANALKTALKHPKTPERALAIRNSVSYLDFSKQLNFITQECIPK